MHRNFSWVEAGADFSFQRVPSPNHLTYLRSFAPETCLKSSSPPTRYVTSTRFAPQGSARSRASPSSLLVSDNASPTPLPPVPSGSHINAVRLPSPVTYKLIVMGIDTFEATEGEAAHDETDGEPEYDVLVRCTHDNRAKFSSSRRFSVLQPAQLDTS